MFVICLFYILIYSPSKSAQTLIIFFQIELFKSSGDIFFYILYKYRNIFQEKKSQWESFPILCSPNSKGGIQIEWIEACDNANDKYWFKCVLYN